MHDVWIELRANDLLKDITVLKATFRVKPFKQLQDKGILVDRYPNLPVLESLTFRLIFEVFICDDIVFELCHCTSLTFQKADVLEELTNSDRCNDVENVLFFA